MAILKEARAKKVGGYRGKQAKTGNSLGLRFDKALFQSHPEFSGEVRAHVIAPGRMLVVAEPLTKSQRREGDPVMEAFLGFLAGRHGSVSRANQAAGPSLDEAHRCSGGPSACESS